MGWLSKSRLSYTRPRYDDLSTRRRESAAFRSVQRSCNNRISQLTLQQEGFEIPEAEQGAEELETF